MAIVKLTGFFKDDDGRGWSETHCRQAGTEPVNLESYLAQFDNLMKQFRVPLLARDCAYLGCRASYRSASGRVRSQPLLLNPPVDGPKTVQQESVWSAAPNSSVKVRMTDSTRTANSDIYIRGYWDQVEVAGYVNFDLPIGAEWKRRADSYLAALITAGYGWEGIDGVNTRRGIVESYSADTQNIVTFTVTTTQGPALVGSPDRVAVRFARINNSRSVLNRILICNIVNETTIRTVQPIATGPFTAKGTFVYAVRTFIPYAAVSYFRLAQRKMGRPFGLPVGRLPARQRV